MALATLGVKTKGDKRDRYLHHGHPLVKLGLWLLFTALPFLFPNEVLNAYSECSGRGGIAELWQHKGVHAGMAMAMLEASHACRRARCTCTMYHAVCMPRRRDSHGPSNGPLHTPLFTFVAPPPLPGVTQRRQAGWHVWDLASS